MNLIISYVVDESKLSVFIVGVIDFDEMKILCFAKVHIQKEMICRN
jgi:hypothetical protein